MATHSEYSRVEQVSHRSEKIWDTFEIDHERIPYFKYKSTFERKEYMEKGYSPSDKFDGEDLHIDNNYCNTPICFERDIFPRLECTYSYHKTNYIEDVGSLKDHF